LEHVGFPTFEVALDDVSAGFADEPKVEGEIVD
jgi:hypothetical protein